MLPLILKRILLGSLLGIILQDVLPAQEPTPQGPIEILSPVRDRIVLNGVWKCMPAVDPSAQTPTGDWGTIWVPQNWIGGTIKKGTSPEWNTPSNEWKAVWYDRQIDIPASWKGRRVVVDLRRVSTDASISVNGTDCGGVAWPSGTVDITKAVTPGATADLRLLVTAKADAGEHVVMMGTAVNQSFKVANKLATVGLIGEVFLESEPLGPTVSDVFVKTSVRKKEVALDIEVTGMTQEETATVTATMINAAGENEQVFHSSLPLHAQPVQRTELTFPWTNPSLWSPEHPALYRLQLDVTGTDIHDSYPQRFGFREFWVDGRRFFLNGQEIRLRPICSADPLTQDGIDGFIDGVRSAGFNIVEQWPADQGARGTDFKSRDLWCERADEKGMMTMGDALDFGKYLAKDGKGGAVSWFDPGVSDSYRAELDAEMRRYRNDPSVVMWATTPNWYGAMQDQNPRTLGVGSIEFPLPPWALQDIHQAAGRDALNTIRSVDPTRPVFSHSGDMVGDVYTVNSYLNLIPLQEREEWLSNYSEKGDMPLMAVEFGLPLSAPTMQRGRWGYVGAVFTEPLETEFCATYLGPDSYRLESPVYRAAISGQYAGKDKWTTFHNSAIIDQEPSFQELETLFIRNTWRSWRAAGITGGMVPWNVGGQVFVPPTTAPAKNPVFQPGLRGIFRNYEERFAHFLDPAYGWKVTPSAQALIDANGPTLAWIAGAPENFYEKAHSFRVGQTVNKQICLINDLPGEVPYHVAWKIVLRGKTLHEESADGKIANAGNLFLPLSFSVPSGVDGEKIDGEIDLDATVGGRTSSDRFPFRVFNPTVAELPKVFLFDPAGNTGALLKSLGADAVPWTGQASASERPLLVIGRSALSGGKPPGDLEKFVASGGRLLVMAQDPEWLRKTIGFRVSRQVSRRFFPVMTDHPVTAGLDAEDFRDWAGAGTLVEARPVYDLAAKTEYGWHWGNQGSVSSAAIEKPHFSGWTPILEGEFDLAYSPLMQLDYGQGAVVLCTLDLENQTASDPVAELLARRILQQAATASLTPRRKTVFLGGDDDAKLLQGIGVIFDRAAILPSPDALAIVGPGAAVTPGALNDFATQGGNVLVLANPAGQNLAGSHIENHDGFFGATEFQSSFNSPLAGLSVSDLHFRTGISWPLLTQGGTIAGEGLVSSQSVGTGTIVAEQLDPRLLNADQIFYFRFTRWRQTRALTQLLANLGATFNADKNIFNPSAKSPFYYPDYKAGVGDGDDPARYYRW